MALILHLDDEPWLLKIVSGFLKERGHEVLSLSNSYEALHLLRTESVDLFIQDLNRPDLGGKALYQQLKADLKLKQIPVLITSGNQLSWPSVADELQVLNDIFLPKPFSLVEFTAAIDQLLSRSKSN
jgi:DNA-binding response OmpR family regulator